MLEHILIPFIVILLGPPGGGKGTQAKRLSQDYQLPQISTGDLFREEMAAQTLIGEKVQDFMQSGQLVPDEIVLEMLFSRLSKPDCSKGCLLDGVPRTIAQADQLREHLATKTKLLVLYLDVSDEEIIKRATGRLVCTQCGTIYNRYILPPLNGNICDRCGEELKQREDDKLEVVENRLKVYRNQTAPLIEYYAQQGLLKAFNGNQTPDAIYQEIKSYIDHRINFQ